MPSWASCFVARSRSLAVLDHLRCLMYASNITFGMSINDPLYFVKPYITIPQMDFDWWAGFETFRLCLYVMAQVSFIVCILYKLLLRGSCCLSPTVKIKGGK